MAGTVLPSSLLPALLLQGGGGYRVERWTSAASPPLATHSPPPGHETGAEAHRILRSASSGGPIPSGGGDGDGPHGHVQVHHTSPAASSLGIGRPRRLLNDGTAWVGVEAQTDRGRWVCSAELLSYRRARGFKSLARLPSWLTTALIEANTEGGDNLNGRSNPPEGASAFSSACLPLPSLEGCLSLRLYPSSTCRGSNSRASAAPPRASWPSHTNPPLAVVGHLPAPLPQLSQHGFMPPPCLTCDTLSAMQSDNKHVTSPPPTYAVMRPTNPAAHSSPQAVSSPAAAASPSSPLMTRSTYSHTAPTLSVVTYPSVRDSGDYSRLALRQVPLRLILAIPSTRYRHAAAVDWRERVRLKPGCMTLYPSKDMPQPMSHTIRAV